MAFVSQTPATASYPIRIQAVSVMLDGIKNNIQAHSVSGAIDTDLLSSLKLVHQIAVDYLKKIHAEMTQANVSDTRITGHYNAIANEWQTVEKQIISLIPVGRQVSHAQFTQGTNTPVLHTIPVPQVSSAPQRPLAQKQVVSFKITPSVQGPQTTPSLSTALGRISLLLRAGNNTQALQEFSQLPQDVKQGVYAGLWAVRGRPMQGNPIAHDNFGEVSFLDRELRCMSTPQQKACAVELYTMHASILDMIALLGKRDFAGAQKIFTLLPPQVQNEIYGKHWEVCGKPTDQSADESLRKITHPDFGKVSFLGTEARCDVPPEKKIETLKAYLPELTGKFRVAQELTEKKIVEWQAIDLANILGPQKTAQKKDSLHALAKTILPLFLGSSVQITVPVPAISQTTGRPGESFEALAAAYAEKYPCLKPFFLQLVNKLVIPGEQLNGGPISTLDTPKPSQVQAPNLQNMSDTQRTTYRTNIMMETLDTLNKGYYINSKGEKVTLDLSPAVISLQCEANSGYGTQRRNQYRTQLFLDKKDCLTVTRNCAERGLHPIVLDAASDGHFGGGYMTGAGAQEENMTRRSGLCIAADTIQRVQTKNFYPLHNNGSHAGLYVATVPVFRGEEAEGYPYLDKPFETAVAVTAAYNFNDAHQAKNHVKHPNKLITDQATGELRIPTQQAIETKEKLRTVLHMAEKYGHDSIVLMPLGCGAFCNPPKQICEMIMELVTQEFPNSFKEVHISVIDDHNTGKAHNPRGNFAEFKDTIENRFLAQLQSAGGSFQITS